MKKRLLIAGIGILGLVMLIIGSFFFLGGNLEAAPAAVSIDPNTLGKTYTLKRGQPFYTYVLDINGKMALSYDSKVIKLVKTDAQSGNIKVTYYYFSGITPGTTTVTVTSSASDTAPKRVLAKFTIVVQ